MAIDHLRDALTDLRASAQALTALALSLEARRRNAAREHDPLTVHSRAVVDALGLTAAVDGAAEGDVARFLAEVRAEVLFSARLLGRRPEAGGWRQGDVDLHQAFGDVSAGFAALLRGRIAPRLAGLAERLGRPGAAFLDVGTGVGALALGVLREWPGLRAVGIEPLAETADLARRAAAAAGCAHRMEVRVGRGEDLAERDAYDLAFIPSAFIPEPAIAALLERAAGALRRGGWILVGKVEPDREPLASALARFRVASWGGTIFADGAAETLLARFGLRDVTRVEPRPRAGFGFAAGRRP